MSDGLTLTALERRALIRTPDQRLRVFVSSTLEELATERAAARAAIEALRLAPVMFELGARPHPPRDLYRAYLEQSHVFIGIYWQRYGWVAPGEPISGLEDEYDRSGSCPRLVYLKEPAVDRDARLARLLERIRDDDVASYRRFGSADELGELIGNDLAVLLTERFEQAVGPETGRPAARPRTNLPVPRNTLVGRSTELEAACGQLARDGAPLLTLTGTGGSGKSRLALEVALRLLDRFDDGAFLVPLESVRDPASVVPAIAETLELRMPPDRSPLAALASQVGDARMLLLLDNFEHVVAAGPDVSTLLERCPRLAILATSRTPLRLRGEQRLVVSPLPVPTSQQADPADLAGCAAVELFAERARGVLPGFALTGTNAHTVAQICQRLDGLPLAIELAAARLSLLAPTELLDRLDRRFDLLQGGTRDLPERQRTLRRTIDWSHDLLTPSAQAVFRRLAVFAGGATLEAAESVTSGDGVGADALEVIGSLIDDSMLTTAVGERGDLRIGMLDSIRAYAAERLDESGEGDRVRQRHARWCRTLTERAEPRLSGPEEPAWAARLRADRGNLRAALEWSATRDPALGVEIGAAIWRFWENHGMIEEGRIWLERVLAPEGPDSPARAKALHGAAALACYLGEYATARQRANEALAIARRVGDRDAVARALNELGVVALYEGDLASARRGLEESIAIKRELGDSRPIANTLTNLGLVAAFEGNLETAEALQRECLAIYRELDEQLGVALATSNLADVARLRGRLDDALSGQLEALRMFRATDDHEGVASSLESLAKIANATGDHAHAIRLFAHAATIRETTHTAPSSLERDDVARELDLAQAAVDVATFDHEWQSGRQLPTRSALEPWVVT